MKNNRRDFIKLSTAGLMFTLPACNGRDGVNFENHPGNNERLYELWLWIELIGFDNTQADYGVSEFLERTGFIPDAFSLLMSRSDFVHGHVGMSKEWVLPPEYCSYGGRPYSKERERQDWTNYQLRDLIRELHTHGINVYFSLFSGFINQEGEGRWAYKYPEVWRTGKDGKPVASIYAPKRFKDGSFYADFFKEKLSEVIDDYGFDGWHAADGYSPYGAFLSQADYSDDTVDRFLQHTGVMLPDSLSTRCESNEAACIQRSDWIWQNRRHEWIDFKVDIWTDFYKTVTGTLHEKGKQLILNSTAHIDPFESIYRHGFDYRRLVSVGVDRFTVWTNASAVELMPRLTDWDGKIDEKSLATLMLIKAEAPKSRLVPFTGIHDTEEEWSTIHHVPTVLEREIYTVANAYVYNERGIPQRCSSGTMGMLSDSLSRQEWQWLKEKWDLGYSADPDSIGGVTLIWSDRLVESQINDYIETRRCSVHKLLYELMALGAPVYSVSDTKWIKNIQGPILVINPNLFPSNQLEQVLSYRNGAIILVGGKVTLPESPEYEFEDVYPPDALFCAVYHSGKTFDVALKKNGAEIIPEDINTVPEALSFATSSYFRKVSDSFLRGCVSVISQCVDDPIVVSVTDVSARGRGVELETDSVEIKTLKYSERCLRLLIRNKRSYYVTPTVQMNHRIDEIIVKTDFPPTPVRFEEREFQARIPGKGMVIVDIVLVSR